MEIWVDEGIFWLADGSDVLYVGDRELYDLLHIFSVTDSSDIQSVCWGIDNGIMTICNEHVEYCGEIIFRAREPAVDIEIPNWMYTDILFAWDKYWIAVFRYIGLALFSRDGLNFAGSYGFVLDGISTASVSRFVLQHNEMIKRFLDMYGMV